MAPANFVANDGNGRDADPSDPGDWITVQEKTLYPDDCTDATETPPYSPSDSTWHGTHMAGIVAATANNSVGIAGIGWNVKIVPMRALGKCGGDLNDIAEAIRWAAGLPVSGVPANPNKASVISLSLGGGDTCSTYMQNAVDAATAAGATIVVAATGNDGSIGLIAPANCNGVIAVTAHTINGENADYANIASTMLPKAEMLSAPAVVRRPRWVPADRPTTRTGTVTTSGRRCCSVRRRRPAALRPDKAARHTRDSSGRARRHRRWLAWRR